MQASFLHIPNQDPVITAGDTLYVHLNTVDRYGNPTAAHNESIRAEVIGGAKMHQLTAEAAMAQLQTDSHHQGGAIPNPHCLVYAVDVRKAGIVVVGVSMSGVQLCGGWPRAVLVVPAKPTAARCFMGGHYEVGTILQVTPVDLYAPLASCALMCMCVCVCLQTYLHTQVDASICVCMHTYHSDDTVYISHTEVQAGMLAVVLGNPQW